MPVIDLKNVSIYFEDGTALTGAVNNLMAGAVNNVAGYSIGAASIIVSGFTGAVPVGSKMTIGTNTARVTSTVETGGNTTTINFTPALTASVANSDVVNINGFAISATTLVVDGFTSKVPVGARLSIAGDDKYTVVSTVETGPATTKITITPALTVAAADNAVVLAYGVYLKIKVGDGTCTFAEKKPREYKLDRGLLDSVRNGDQVPMDVSIGLMYVALTASVGDPPTPEDALKQRGAAAGWVNADVSDPCAPYAINIRLDHNPPGCTAFQVERVILPAFRYEELNHDPKAGTIACTGKCNALEATVTRFDRT